MSDARWPFLSVDELLSMPWGAVVRGIPYIPAPNVGDVVFSDKLAADPLTPTAFVFPFLDDGSCVFAVNAKRGIETPGGHRDPLPRLGRVERPEETAEREAVEEAGAEVVDLVPVGFLRAKTTAPRPEGYPYPHPVSCQQFFAARVARLVPHTAKEECLLPVTLTYDEACGVLEGRVLELFKRAHSVVMAATIPTPI
jgi:8-oxo-dGTP pyrophosphatase MutT (NUDIX family)